MTAWEACIAISQHVHVSVASCAITMAAAAPRQARPCRYMLKGKRVCGCRHEGGGSLLSELKRRGWATELVAGEGSGSFSGCSIFMVHITLTDAGACLLVATLRRCRHSCLPATWRMTSTSARPLLLHRGGPIGFSCIFLLYRTRHESLLSQKPAMLSSSFLGSR